MKLVISCQKSGVILSALTKNSGRTTMQSRYKRPVSIAILDDHYVVLHGMKDILNQDSAVSVRGVFSESESLIKFLRSELVDVTVMDFELSPSDTDGLNLIGILRRTFPQTALLVVSAHYNAATVASALRAGASGFIGKNRPSDDLHRALADVSEGKVFIEAEMVQLLSDQQIYGNKLIRGNLSETNVQEAISLTALSPKELEVIRCFLTGMKVGEIAEKFNRSIKTVSGQKQRAMRKLGLKADHELYLIKSELLKVIQP